MTSKEQLIQPAFPVIVEYNENGIQEHRVREFTLQSMGLTKREYFAGLAMQGLLSNPGIMEVLKKVDKENRHVSLANTALMNADELLKQLNP